jgi:hypothetical protein
VRRSGRATSSPEEWWPGVQGRAWWSSA